MDIPTLDKNLYDKYKGDILQAMQNTPFNLSREITKLLGPYSYFDPQSPCQPPHYGLIERKAHSYTGVQCTEKILIKNAIDYLNKLLQFDPWAKKLEISFKYIEENDSDEKDIINLCDGDSVKFDALVKSISLQTKQRNDFQC